MRLDVLGKFSALFLFAAILSTAHAQSLPSPTYDDQLGLQPYGAYHGGDIDSVGLGNGTLTLHMPFLSYPQRGSLQFSFNLFYNNEPQHVAEEVEGTNTYYVWGYGGVYTPLPIERGDVYVGWAQQVGAIGTAINVDIPPETSHYAVYSLQFADGSKHPFGNLGTYSLLENTGTNRYFQYGGPFETLDGTGWRMNGPLNTETVVSYPNATGVIAPDGTMYGPADGATVEDPNGNQISMGVTAFTDSLGRSIPIPPTAISKSNTGTSSCPTSPLTVSFAVSWSVPSPGGVNESYIFCYVKVAVNIPPVNGAQASAFSSTKLQSIVLPNGTSWNFTYNDPGDGSVYNGAPINYGTLTQVTLPTTGSISYTYSTLGTLLCGLEGRFVATRTLNDTTGPHTWTYAYTISDGLVTSTKVTDPLLNYAVHTIGGGCAPIENEVQYYSSAGALLKTVTTAFADAAVSNNSNNSINVVPTAIKTAWANNQTDQTTMVYDSGFSYSDYIGGTTTGTGTGTPDVGLYGKVLTKTDYDYGAGSPGSVLRTTTTAYEAFSTAAYLTNNMINLPSSVQITGTKTAYTTYGYDENPLGTSGVSKQHDSSPPTGTYRGNQTSVHRQLNNGSATSTTNCAKSVSSGGYLVSYATYYDTGTVSNSVDSCGSSATDKLHMTTYLYSSTYFGAYPTSITNPLSQITQHSYDSNTGQLSSTTDPNLQVTNFTYDNMWRIAEVTYPDGGKDTFTHQETTYPFTATLTKAITTTPLLNYVTTDVFDGLGRISQSQLTSDPSGTDYTDTTYDANGRKHTVSNPYRTKTDPTYGITSYVYDGIGRTCVVVPPNGTSVANTSCPATQPSNDVFTTYTGNQTTVTDQQGKSRKSQTDGLGRLTNVWEDPNNLDYHTVYTYDQLDDLVSVVQGGSRDRSFAYDSLKRLTSSNNPESGAVSYTYDADSNVVTKKDARGITITYGYDVLNRITGKTYSNGDTPVTYGYDAFNENGCYNIGHRTSMTDAAGSTDIACYDSMGRETNEYRTTAGVMKETIYAYNLDGSLRYLADPGKQAIIYTYDGAARPISATSEISGAQYALGATYAPQGALSSLTLGTTASFAGININNTYNSRLQPNELKAWSTAGTAMDLTYTFLDTSSHNNGNVMGITNNVDGTRSQQFSYDSLNRILSAQTTSTSGGNCWGLNFGYDQWANLTSASVSQCTAPMLSVTAGTNNRLTTTGFSYDADGNVLADGTNSYTWNAESQIESAAGVNYTYDGDGNRAEKSNGKIYWYNGGGNDVLDESDLSGNITDEYIYFGGKRIAHNVVSGNSIYYYAEDFLGTSRVMMTSTGTVCYDADFYPYGGERAVTSTCAQNYKFEGKERDAETNNDDFGARYYSSPFGRWLSPDWSPTPAPVPYANLTNPQTLNLYAMTRDNPETFADLDGHDLQPPGEYSGNITVAGPGDFGPPPTMTAVNNLSDFGGNYYAGASCTSDDCPQSQNSEKSANADAPKQTIDDRGFFSKLADKLWVKFGVGVGLGAKVVIDGEVVNAEAAMKSQGTVSISGKISVSVVREAGVSAEIAPGVEAGVKRATETTMVKNGVALSEHVTERDNVFGVKIAGRSGDASRNGGVTLLSVGLCVLICAEVGIGFNTK
jgi:RHS repeat-associated protein